MHSNRPNSGHGHAWLDDNVTFNDMTVGNATTFLHSDLGINTVYYYKIVALNNVGQGIESEIVSTTTFDLPGQVTGLTATVGDGSVTLSWEVPSSGGSPITGYKIYRDGVHVATVDGSSTSYIDTGLTNGQEYIYSIRATNVVGDGAASANLSAKPQGAAIPGFMPVLVSIGIMAAMVFLIIKHKKTRL